MISRVNNFDLIRLFAAFQVLIIHGLSHLNINTNHTIWSIFRLFPGVLIFFTISGFLICSSFDRNNNLRQYFFNRILRIFPALWVCLIITIGLLFVFRIISSQDLIDETMLKWTFTQITFFQFWTPQILRSWGVGTPNGSLWTIPIELQFYILLPAIMLAFKQIRPIYKLLFLVLFSIVCNNYLSTLIGKHATIAVKLAGVSLIPYLYCFLFGALTYLYWNKIRTWVEGKAHIWMLVFVAYCLITGKYPSDYC